MKCQRCLQGQEAKYRVHSDVLDLKVCASCAAEARSLSLTIELLHPDETSRDTANGGPKERVA
jgi:protein-arginine kinase activator protein McsA